MRPHLLFVAAVLAAPLTAQQDDKPVVFRSDVSLVRVDVRVSDRTNKTIPNLTAKDFELKDNGRVQPIRSFASEEMPLDVMFLIDVSASMKPHVERLVDAARTAFQTLKPNDHIGIMVFDRTTRVRHPFDGNIEAVEAGFKSLLRQESFNGGTDITRGLVDAAKYVQKNARKDARRAIVILTDDQTEMDRDEVRVGNALIAADAVLSALIAPDAMRYSRVPGGGYPGGGYPGGGRGRYPGGSRYPGGGYPGGGYPGGGLPPDIIFGRRNPPVGGGGGGQYPGPYGGGRTKSAGTSEIALDSGGDSFPVDDASALDTTLARLRQRYSLYFNVPAGARSGEMRNVTVDLASAARRRFPDADLKYRQDYRAPEGAGSTPAAEGTESAAAAAAQSQETSATTTASTPSESESPAVIKPKRRAMGESYGSHGPNPDVGAGSSDPKAADAKPVDPKSADSKPADPKPAAATPATPATDASGGWRRATPGDTAPPPSDSTTAKPPAKKP